jgi:hypothetical protein
MAINTQLPLGVQPMQIENPVNQLAKVLQIKDMQQGQQMNALKMDEYRRSVEDGNALRADLAQPGANPYEVLLKRGKIKEATDFAKGKADIGKTEAEAKYKQIETAHKRVDLAGQTMGWLRQNPSLENAQLVVNHLVSNGGMDQAEGQGLLAQLQANPQGIAQFAEMTFRSALAAKDQLAKIQTNNIGGQTVTQGIDPVTGKASMVSAVQNTQSPDNAATNARVAADNAASRQQAERHFNTTQNAPRGQFIETTDGYVLADPRTGGVRPVMGADGQRLKGKAADRTLNETQAKANMFGTRMREADRILNDLEDKGVTNSGLIKGAVEGAAGLTPFMGDKMSDAAGSVMNAAPRFLGGPNSQQQQVEQARRDFINAVLRKESGAVISQQEFANAERQYFPQPGNDKDVIQQKRALRKRATELMLAEVPGGSRQPPSGGGGRSVSGVVNDEQPRVIDFGSLR